MQGTLRLPRSARHKERFHRTPADFAVLFALVLVSALAAAVSGWQVWHTYRVYPGVTVAGVPVGGMTRSAALVRADESLLRYPLPSITVHHDGRQWPITGDDVRVTADLTAAVNQAYLVGRTGTWSTQLNDQIAALLGGVDVAPAIRVDVAQLRYTVARIAGDVRRPARAETRIGDIVVPAQSGVDVDVEATVEALLAELETASGGESIVIPLQVFELAPPASPAAASAAGADEPGTPSAEAGAAGNLSAMRTLRVRDVKTGLEFALDAAELQTILPAGMSAAGDPVAVDEANLRTIVEQWAAQVNVPPRDARLGFDHATQSPVVVQPSRAGRRLDVEATVATIRGALAGGRSTADLVVTPVAPAVDSNRVGAMGIQELIASGTTYFQGSSAARVRNIDVAAAKFENIVIPPDGIFSFNEWVEDVSAANGFEDSLIIWGDRTAVGIGGGVCQVSTTVFRAAYNAGFPLVERYNHGYIVDWYGEPGLDATIFTPTVDFRFRNDSGAYLLIEPVMDADNGTLTFDFYGTKPDREVIIGEPQKSDVKPPPPPQYTVDDSLAPGQIDQVEWAKEGMTVEVTRTIIEDGETRTDTLTSVYQPWRAVYLVGSEDDIPPEARTAAEETPTPAVDTVDPVDTEE